MNHGVVTDVDDKIDDLPPEFVLGRKLQRRDKKEYFQYFSLPWPTSPSSEKLSLEQGGFVMDVIDESRQMWSAVEVSQESFQQVVVMSSDSFER